MKLRLLDLDGSVVAQHCLVERARSGDAQVIDLRAEGDALRLWASRSDMRRFARRLTEEGAGPGRGCEVTFVGSGDYHHLTAMLVARAGLQPLSIVHFDNHPDWGLWPPAYHCGSWVNRALDLPNVQKVVTLGPCSETGTWPQFKGANLRALRDGRLEMHPWRHAPSRVLGRADGGPMHKATGSQIHWNNLADHDWQQFLDAMVARLPTEAVWITIDKDVLDFGEAVTNWNQGQMPLDAVLTAIRTIAGVRQVVGIDICGEFAPPRFPNPAKRLLARFDQPKPPSAPDTAINARTNQRLLELFDGLSI